VHVIKPWQPLAAPAACAAPQAVEATGNKVLAWDQMLEMGAAKPVLADPPKPDDLSTIMYTSGTTGGLLQDMAGAHAEGDGGPNSTQKSFVGGNTCAATLACCWSCLPCRAHRMQTMETQANGQHCVRVAGAKQLVVLVVDR
jgi:hypothetical protein